MNENMPPQYQHVSVQHRVSRAIILQITENITSEYIEEILDELHRLDISPDDRLELHIACYGGEIEATLHFINTVVLMFGSNISTFITANAFSAASFIFMIGSQRFVFEESSMLIHTYSGWSGGKSGDILGDAKHNSKRFKRLLKKFFGRFLTKKEIKQIMTGKDFYLTAEEMIERGMATNMLRVMFTEGSEEEIGEEQ